MAKIKLNITVIKAEDKVVMDTYKGWRVIYLEEADEEGEQPVLVDLNHPMLDLRDQVTKVPGVYEVTLQNKQIKQKNEKFASILIPTSFRLLGVPDMFNPAKLAK